MGAVCVLKSIKPKRLKDSAFRLNMLNAMRRVATEVKQDFRETTASWSHKVEFEQVVSLTGPGPEMIVGTDDKIFGYVDEGTKPHTILPKGGGLLAFQSGYSAKTRPGVLGSSAGGKYGPLVFSRGVHHPGTEARGFSKMLQKRWEPLFKRRMEDAMSKFRTESGHAI